MKVSSEKPVLLYCGMCGDLGRFHGADDHEIAVHLSASGWQAKPKDDGGLSVICPTCYVEDLRTRAHVENKREGTGTVEPPLQEVVRARRIEVVNDQGRAVLTARCGTNGGKMTLMDNSGSRVMIASAAEIGGMLGLADHRGTLLWRAPCAGEGCKPNGQHK